MPNTHWTSLAGISAQTPPAALLSWLSEPGLLTARVRERFGDAMRFRMLGALREAPLHENLRARLGVPDTSCFLREIEFARGAERVIYAQTVFPASTVAEFPWLRDLGAAPLGEALRGAGLPLERDPLEYSALGHQHPLATAARAGEISTQVDLWARRAVYRLAGRPILVQEVFLPALLDA